jgi:hypothetical protein
MAEQTRQSAASQNGILPSSEKSAQANALKPFFLPCNCLMPLRVLRVFEQWEKSAA